jgi:hypothetical protein
MHRKRGQIAPAIIRVAVDIVVAIAEYRATFGRYSLVVARDDRMANADDAAKLSFEPDLIVAGDEVAHLNAGCHRALPHGYEADGRVADDSLSSTTTSSVAPVV